MNYTTRAVAELLAPLISSDLMTKPVVHGSLITVTVNYCQTMAMFDVRDDAVECSVTRGGYTSEYREPYQLADPEFAAKAVKAAYEMVLNVLDADEVERWVKSWK